jgi:hypothetical protein
MYLLLVAGFHQSLGLFSVYDYWVLRWQHQGTDNMEMVG